MVVALRVFVICLALRTLVVFGGLVMYFGGVLGCLGWRRFWLGWFWRVCVDFVIWYILYITVILDLEFVY